MSEEKRCTCGLSNVVCVPVTGLTPPYDCPIHGIPELIDFVPTHGSDEGEGEKRPSFLEQYSHEQDAILEAVKPYHDALEKGFAPPPATSEVGTILCDESYSEGPVKRVVAVTGKQSLENMRALASSESGEKKRVIGGGPKSLEAFLKSNLIAAPPPAPDPSGVCTCLGNRGSPGSWSDPTCPVCHPRICLRCQEKDTLIQSQQKELEELRENR